MSGAALTRRTTPPPSLTWLELRALGDLARLPRTLASTYWRRPQTLGQGRTVVVLPGFGADDRSMWPLRHYLRRYGFDSRGWGLGRNLAGLDRPHRLQDVSWGLSYAGPYRGEAGVPWLCDLMVQTVRDLVDAEGAPVSLVGWSLGGTIAREVARDLPGVVDQVVTLGSPVIGGPKYTRAAATLQRKGLNLDWIEAQVDQRNRTPLPCPVSAIVSPTDGVVDLSAAVCPQQANTRYHYVDAAHLGLGLNAAVLEIVVRELVSNGEGP